MKTRNKRRHYVRVQDWMRSDVGGKKDEEGEEVREAR
jgi:hypothetical protein